jgi:hypothetical protein
MTEQQFLEEIRRLPVAQRVALIEAISRSVREDLRAGEAHASEVESGGECVGDDAPLSQSLLGIIKFEGGPPSDETVKEMITEHLLEKYS